MSGLVGVVVVVAVVVLVIGRQVKPQKVTDGGRWWLVPGVLAFLAVRQHGLTDPHHQAASVALLAAELVVGAGMGAVWAFTTRIWMDEAGAVWARGTKATAGAWTGGIVLRVALGAIGALMGVHQGGGSMMLALAVTLLIRTGLVVWRARDLRPAYRTTAAV